MADSLAQVEDLEDVWRPLTDDEKTRADRLLSKASGLLRTATRQTIDTRIALFATNPTAQGAVDPDVAATVVATIVKRFFSNIEGAVSETETVTVYSRTVSYALRGDKNDVRGEMIVTDQDLATLSPEPALLAGSFTLGLSPVLAAGRAADRSSRYGRVLASELVSFRELGL